MKQFEMDIISQDVGVGLIHTSNGNVLYDYKKGKIVRIFSTKAIMKKSFNKVDGCYIIDNNHLWVYDLQTNKFKYEDLLIKDEYSGFLLDEVTNKNYVISENNNDVYHKVNASNIGNLKIVTSRENFDEYQRKNGKLFFEIIDSKNKKFTSPDYDKIELTKSDYNNNFLIICQNTPNNLLSTNDTDIFEANGNFLGSFPYCEQLVILTKNEDCMYIKYKNYKNDKLYQFIKLDYNRKTYETIETNCDVKHSFNTILYFEIKKDKKIELYFEQNGEMIKDICSYDSSDNSFWILKGENSSELIHFKNPHKKDMQIEYLIKGEITIPDYNKYLRKYESKLFLVKSTDGKYYIIYNKNGKLTVCGDFLNVKDEKKIIEIFNADGKKMLFDKDRRTFLEQDYCKIDSYRFDNTKYHEAWIYIVDEGNSKALYKREVEQYDGIDLKDEKIEALRAKDIYFLPTVIVAKNKMTTKIYSFDLKELYGGLGNMEVSCEYWFQNGIYIYKVGNQYCLYSRGYNGEYTWVIANKELLKLLDIEDEEMNDESQLLLKK